MKNKHLEPVVEKFREYKNAKATNEEAREMLSDSSLDEDFAKMVKEEFEQSKEDLDRINEELKVLLLPRDPNDDKNVIIEIRGGAGGEESALFAGVLFRKGLLSRSRIPLCVFGFVATVVIYGVIMNSLYQFLSDKVLRHISLNLPYLKFLQFS